MKSIKALSLCLALVLVAFVNAAHGAQVTQQTNEADKSHATSRASCPRCSMKHPAQHHDAAQASSDNAQAKQDCDDCCAGCADCKHDGASCCAMHHEGDKDGAAASCPTCKMGAHKEGGQMSDASCCMMHDAHHEQAAAGVASHEHNAAHAMRAGADGEGCTCCAMKPDAR
jgi:hypothetical protein